MEEHRKQHKKPDDYRLSKRCKYQRKNHKLKRERANKLSQHVDKDIPVLDEANDSNSSQYPFTCKIVSYMVDGTLFMAPEKHDVPNGKFLNITSDITFFSDDHYAEVMSDLVCPF